MSYIGTSKVGSMYLGDTKIGKAYLGDDLVYAASGGVTDAPTLTISETSTNFLITASGNGTLVLSVNGNVVSNPYTLAKQSGISTASVSATAQEQGKEVSEAATASFQVPPAGSIPNLNASGSWTDNKSFATSGGGITDNSNGCISPYIPITGGNKVTFLVKGTQRSMIVEYNANKQYVDYWKNNTSSAKTITTGSNTRYIRFGLYYDTIDEAYIQNATTSAYYFKGINVT